MKIITANNVIIALCRVYLYLFVIVLTQLYLRMIKKTERYILAPRTLESSMYK